MALPFRVDPESSQRPAEADPFLEFESERPGRRVSSHPFFKDQLIRPEPVPQPDLASLHAQTQSLPPLPPILQTSKPVISPVVGFAVGVAGLAAAAVAYYQLAQFVAKRNAEAPPPAGVAGPATAGEASTPGTADGSTPSAPTKASAGANNSGAPTNSGPARQPASSAPRSANTGARPAAAGAATAAEPTTGLLTFDTPLSFQVYAGGQLQGTSVDGRIAVPAGTRSVTLVNSLLEFRQTLPVSIQAGQSLRLAVPLPNGSLSVNALPWAEVSVDGSPIGTTPLANIAVAIGSHEIVWRHPTLGQRRQTVVVKAQTPVRIGVDFNR